MAFKDNFRIEKIYFQRVKDDAQILGSWKNDPRRYSREEIVRVAKDACDSVLMLYRLLGECWNDALNQIEKLSAELEALAGKAEAYHDELNEKIDEVNNYLNTQIKNLEIRVENIENSIEAFGGLPSNANAEEGDVLTVGENHVNEWKTLNTAPIYIEANYDDDDEVNVILTLDNEPITNSEIFALLDAGKDVKIILNSFDTGVHNELPVILNYVKTYNETVVEEDMDEIEFDVETRYFQTCIMPNFSIGYDVSQNVTYFNAYNLGISTLSNNDVIVVNNRVNVVPYTFKGMEISLFSPVKTPTQQQRVDLDVLNAPQMHEFYDNEVLRSSTWLNSINATLCYYDDTTYPYKYIKANLYRISVPDFDASTNTYKSELLFTEIQITTTAPYYNIRRWKVIWEYNPENKTDTFYIPAGMG